MSRSERGIIQIVFKVLFNKPVIKVVSTYYMLQAKDLKYLVSYKPMSTEISHKTVTMSALRT